MQELERYTDKEIMRHTTGLLRASTNAYDHFHNDIILGFYYRAHLLAKRSPHRQPTRAPFRALTVRRYELEVTAHCIIVGDCDAPALAGSAQGSYVKALSYLT